MIERDFSSETGHNVLVFVGQRLLLARFISALCLCGGFLISSLSVLPSAKRLFMGVLSLPKKYSCFVLIRDV